jgi:protein tyrosine kinase modulator
MAEDFDEKSSEGFSLQHYLGIARRRHLHFLIPFFVGWLAVWTASWILPPRYKSSTLILVEQPTMPKDYVTPNVNDDLQERLQSITQQILSRTRLLHIIDQLNLYAADRARHSPDEMVERMRKDIQIELVRDARNQITAFNVYYWARDPYVAQQVTSQLTNLFINENLEVRQQQSEDTTKFMEGQLETARQSLAVQEDKIREFKAQHVGELPEQLATNLQILGGLQTQLQGEQDALNTARQQHVYLQTMLDQYRSLQGSSKTPEGAPLNLTTVDQELDKLKAQLADLISRGYTERHPDVRKLKNQIATTEKMRTQIIAGGQTISVGSTAATQNAPSPMAQLQGQLQANETEIANREQGISGMKAKVGEYQGRLNQEPVREQQLADLTRGYDQSKANYDALLKKKNDSAMATSMELLQQGERFRILDPPSLPVKPDFPDRLKFCGMGLGVGLALGAAVAGAFEMADDRAYSEAEIKGLLPVPVISEIPVILTTADEQVSKRKTWLGWALAGLVVVSVLAGSAFSFLHS